MKSTSQFPAWQPIESAPYLKVIWVKNDQMERPVRATRGYVHNDMVHPDNTFFTRVFTEDDISPFRSEKLVCPTQWAPEAPE